MAIDFCLYIFNFGIPANFWVDMLEGAHIQEKADWYLSNKQNPEKNWSIKNSNRCWSLVSKLATTSPVSEDNKKDSSRIYFAGEGVKVKAKKLVPQELLYSLLKSIFYRDFFILNLIQV